MQSAQIIKGIVKIASGKLFDSKYGDKKRINIVVTVNGNDQTIWGFEGSEISRYRQGDVIEYAQNGNEYIFFNLPNYLNDMAKTPQAAQTQSPSPKKWEQPDKVTKQSMLDYTSFQAKVYLHIFKSVSTDFVDMGLKDEQIKDISTTIFIQTQRKFNF